MKRPQVIDGVLAVAVAGSALIVVAYRLDAGVWFDEAYSYLMATRPWDTFAARAWGSEANMFLYYLVLRGWLGLVGATGAAPVEVILRVPSAVFAVASSVVVYLLGLRLAGRIAGLVAAGLYATNYLQMIMAQNARAYSLELLLLGLSWLTFLGALGSDRRRWWFAYVATTALSVYADLYSGLVIIAQVATVIALVIVPGPRRDEVLRARRSIVASWMTAFVLVLPIAVDALTHGLESYVPPVSLHDVRAFFYFMSGNSYIYLAVLLGAAAFGFLVSLPRGRQTWAVIALSAWFGVPLLIAFALTQRTFNLHLFFARYLVVVVPPLCLLAGIAVAALPSRLLQVGAVLVLIAVAAPSLGFYYRQAQVQDVHAPAKWIRDRFQTGDGVVCAPDFQCGIPVLYYFDAYPGHQTLESAAPGGYDWRGNVWSPITADAVRAYATEHRRIFLIDAPLGHGVLADPDAQLVMTVLAGMGYRITDRIEARASGTDTTVVLLEAT